MKSPKKDTKRKIAAFIALFLAFLMVLGAIAPFLYGAEVSSKATLSVQVGYSGLYKVGYPTPVKVKVTTGDSPCDGEILIRVPISNRSYISYGYDNNEQYVDYAYPITMNANESNVYELEVTINTIPVHGALKVELVDKKGNTIATGSPTFTAYSPENILIGTLSDNPESLSYIKGIYYSELMKSYSSKKIPDLTLEDFPGNLGALSAFNIIYINDFDTERLSNMSKDALKSWVNSGGMLFIGSGENYAKTLMGLENIVSVEKTERIVTDDLQMLFESYDREIYGWNEEQVPTESADDLPLESAEADSGENAETAEVEAKLQGIINPFIEEETATNAIVFEFPSFIKIDNAIDTSLYSALNIGQGKVVLFPFNLSEGAVQRSARIKELIARVIQNEATDSIKEGYVDVYANASPIVSPYNLSSIPYQSESITQIISGLVIIYVVAVGPVLFFILRKKDKKEASFVIIPIAALTVTIIIFVMSLNTIYKKPVINEVSLININSGDNYAVKKSNIAVLTGDKGDVAVSMDDYGLSLNPLLGNDYYRYYSYGNYKPIKVTYGNQPGIMYYDNERWETNIFGITQEIDLQGGITADIALQNGVYSGIITNNTPYDLKDVVLSFGNMGYKQIDDIKQGEAYTLHDDLQDKESLYYDMYSFLLSGENYYNNRAKNDAEQMEGWRKTMYRYIVENNYNNKNYYSGRSYGYSQYTPVNAKNVTMYAYIGDNMGSVAATVNGARPISFYNNAVVMDIECTLVFDKAGYKVPFGLVNASEIRAKSYYDASYDYGIYTEMNDEIEFVYDLSEYESLESFMFSNSIQTNTYGDRVSVEIYNYTNESWEDISYSSYTTLEDYISENMELIIRADCTNRGHINFPEIQLEGGVILW